MFLYNTAVITHIQQKEKPTKSLGGEDLLPLFTVFLNLFSMFDVVSFSFAK